MTTAVGTNTIAARCNKEERVNTLLIGGIQNQQVESGRVFINYSNYQLHELLSSPLKETNETNE